MNNKDITKLALKIFSIYVMVQAILAIPQFFSAWVMMSNGSEYSSARWFLVIGIIAILSLIVLSVTIWRLSANSTLFVAQDVNNKDGVISEGFVLSMLGIYLVVYGLTRLIVVVTSAYYSAQPMDNINYNITQTIIYAAVYLAVTILGLSFVIKSNTWSALLNKLRVVGT